MLLVALCVSAVITSTAVGRVSLQLGNGDSKFDPQGFKDSRNQGLGIQSILGLNRISKTADTSNNSMSHLLDMCPLLEIFLSDMCHQETSCKNACGAGRFSDVNVRRF